MGLCGFNSTVGLIYTRLIGIGLGDVGHVSIPLLVWFILPICPPGQIDYRGFNSTVGLIYTFALPVRIIHRWKFQFHCWSDLYTDPACRAVWRGNVSIPLLVWFIRIIENSPWVEFDFVSIPLLVWFIQISCHQDRALHCRFNSTVGLIYTVVHCHYYQSNYKFQFHCWSDLYQSAPLPKIITKNVSIPLLVWFIPSP